MIGMNDDTRFLTQNRHGQLLAEAETRRLTAEGDETRVGGLAGAIHGIGARLFGRRAEHSEMAAGSDTLPAPMTLASERTKSVDAKPVSAAAAAAKATSAESCSGTHVHQAAA
jgi:hypothetical protein